MTRTLTESEMLVIWRRVREIDPLRLDCSADRTDGPDIDAMLVNEMRAWYLDLLDSAPESALAVCNSAPATEIHPSVNGVTLLTAPAGCRRVLSVFFDGWDFPVKVLDSAPPRALANPFFNRPLAFRVGREKVAVFGARGILKEVNCVIDVSDKVYVLDDSALNNIPPSK